MSVQTLNKPNLSTQIIKRTILTLALTLFTSLLIILVISFASKSILNANPVSQPSFSLITSGALTSYFDSNDASNVTTSCTATQINLNLPASTGLAGYTLNFTSPIHLDTLAKNALIDISATNQLSFSLTDKTLGAYSVFNGTSGTLSFDPTSRSGTLSSFLVDENSQQLFVNASWECK